MATLIEHHDTYIIEVTPRERVLLVRALAYYKDEVGDSDANNALLPFQGDAQGELDQLLADVEGKDEVYIAADGAQS